MTKMRWDCSRQNCYLERGHFPIELFDGCFPPGPGRIIRPSFTDIDGLLELNGRFLLLEGKGSRTADLEPPQREAFSKLSALSSKITIVAIRADIPNKRVFEFQYITNGKSGSWHECDLDELKYIFQEWGERARRPNAEMVIKEQTDDIVLAWNRASEAARSAASKQILEQSKVAA